jgi:hypothetical protein
MPIQMSVFVFVNEEKITKKILPELTEFNLLVQIVVQKLVSY